MTRHINILLSVLLLVSNIGLALNVHYCDGNIASVSFNYKTVEPCAETESIKEKSCCAKENNHQDCCENSKIDIKKSGSDNIIVKNFQLDLSSFTVVELWKTTNIIASKEIAFINKKAVFYCDINAPPFYKLYSQLIFYA